MLGMFVSRLLPQQNQLVLPCLTSHSENKNPASLPVLLLVLSLVAGPRMLVEGVSRGRQVAS